MVKILGGCISTHYQGSPNRWEPGQFDRFPATGSRWNRSGSHPQNVSKIF
jgi:hypothetical protein